MFFFNLKILQKMKHKLKVFNTLSKKKEIFIPIDCENNFVKMYVCGMTVYDFCHIGHARVLVVFDMIRRWLIANNYKVFYVRNITDIDDKIIKRAAENNESIQSLTQRFISAMHEDSQKLGVLPPDIEPKATENIAEMLEMIAKLEQNGLAYQNQNSKDVNFAVRKFPNYGKLSGKSIDDLRAGERVNVNNDKNDPLDFVLWKAAKDGEPAWDSKWGKGRPGWHIECSAMSCKFLGNHFDIHGGGQDLQFPHHENEIAQSQGANHSDLFVNYWLHNGFVRVDNQKMSKSLGNFFTIREVLEKYHPEVLRFFILRSHYRGPLNYSDQHLNDAKNSLETLYFTLRDVPAVQQCQLNWNDDDAIKFQNAMNEDFDTSTAMAVLFDIAARARKNQDGNLSAKLKTLANIIGLLENSPEQFFSETPKQNQAKTSSEEFILQKISERAEAKKDKNFALADAIRNELLNDYSVILDDTKDGTKWRFK